MPLIHGPRMGRALTRPQPGASVHRTVDDPRLTLREWLISGRMPSPGRPHDADALLGAAAHQGLVGLMADDPILADAWPAPARDRLRQAAREGLVRSTRQLALAARAHELLLEHGLRSLPLKGAAVAEMLYDSPAHRPMSDIDLLAIDDPNACLRVLRERGFALLSGAEHAWALADPETGGCLELHRAVTSCPRLFLLDTEGLWQRREIRPGQVPCAPAAADLLLLVCLHASFQHGLVLTLSQWLDIRRLTERLQRNSASWQSLAGDAMTARALAAAILGAEIAVGSPLTAHQRAWAEQTLPRGARAQLVRRRMTPWRLLAPEIPALARMRWELAAGRRHRLVWATLFPMNDDAAVAPLAQLARAARRVCRLATGQR
jgi:hypothetical protein